jgi:hypothetical protein
MASKTKGRQLTKAIVRSQLGVLGMLWGDKVDGVVDNAFDKLESAPTDAKAEDIAFRQRLRIELLRQHALAAQDLALAHRMMGAEEVEVEEHYDGSGSGAVGLDVDAEKETLMLGARGNGRVIRKRIIRMKGFGDGEAPLEWLQANLSPDAE